MATRKYTKEVHAEEHEERRSLKLLQSSALAQRHVREYVTEAHEASKRGEPIIWAVGPRHGRRCFTLWVSMWNMP